MRNTYCSCFHLNCVREAPWAAAALRLAPPYQAHGAVPLTQATTHIRDTGYSSTWYGVAYASLRLWPCADGREGAVACGSGGRWVLAAH